MRLWRIRDRATFDRLRSEGVRRRSGPISVMALRLDDGFPPRVAFAVGRGVGPAVVRNRLRRRLRTVARELRLPSGAYLIGASREAAGLSVTELADRVRGALVEHGAPA